MNKNVVIGSKVILREKRLADIWDDYTWEVDTELAQLDAASLETASFPRYLLEYIHELQNPPLTRQRFAIDTLDGKHIGNCSYYNISDTKDELELGIMIGNRSYWNKGCGTDTVTTLVNYIFRHTKCDRIYLKTLELNTRAQKCFQKCGFTLCGHLVKDSFSFVIMEIHRKQR
ncbi:GNAT family N-acetyltransferase [Chloroflexota bacterium]